MEVTHHVSLVTEWIRRVGLLATGGTAAKDLRGAREGTSLSKLVVVVDEFTDENLILLNVRQACNRRGSRSECLHMGMTSVYLNNNNGDGQPVKATHHFLLFHNFLPYVFLIL